MTFVKIEVIIGEVKRTIGRPINHKLLHLKCNNCEDVFTRKFTNKDVIKSEHFCNHKCANIFINSQQSFKDKIAITNSLPETKSKRSLASKTAMSSLSARQKIAESVKLARSKPGEREKMSIASKQSLSGDAMRLKLRLRSIEVWNRPGFKEKMLPILKTAQNEPSLKEHMKKVHKECNNRPDVLVKMSKAVSKGMKKCYEEGRRSVPANTTFCKLYVV